MNTTMSENTIRKLRTIFAAYGLPECIVSDNGVQFTSHEFKNFVLNNKIKHILTPPYHAKSNGACERAVQTVKNGINKMLYEMGENISSLQYAIDNYLFNLEIHHIPSLDVHHRTQNTTEYIKAKSL